MLIGSQCYDLDAELSGSIIVSIFDQEVGELREMHTHKHSNAPTHNTHKQIERDFPISIYIDI